MKSLLAEHLTSGRTAKDWPKPTLPEYAFIGRSNVGKSSLINMLCHINKLARVSGTPGKTRRMLDAVARRVPVDKLAGHYHDTYGQAVANVYASLEAGVACFDSAVAGLGGCPYAPGASGNVATEDVVYMLDGLGIETGISLDALVETAGWISERLGRPPASKVARAVLAKRAKACH